MMRRPLGPTGCRIDIVLATCLLSLYLLFAPSNPLTSPDEEILLRTAVSFLRGDRGAIPPLPEGFATRRGLDDREYAQYGLGLPLASAPLLATALAASSVSSHSEIDYSVVALRPFRLCGVVFNLLVTAASVIVLRRILIQLGVAPRSSVAAALLFGTATIIWPHGRTFFTEPLAGLCLLLAVATLYRADETSAVNPKHLLLAGVCFGWAILTRLDSLVAAPAIACGAARGIKDLPKVVRRWCLVGLPVVVILGMIAGYNYYRFGGISRTGYEDQTEGVRFATPILVGLHGYFLSPGRSLFVYSPVLLLALPGAVALWRRDRWLAVTVGLLVAGYLGVMSKWQNWAGGWDWGPRHIYQITPWLTIAAAVWWYERPRRSKWLYILIAISLLVQLLGLLTDPIQVIRDGNLAHDPIGQQMFVYDPAQCTPVLHARWLLDHAPNLLLVDLVRQGSAWVVAFLVPLCTLGLSIRLLLSWFRESNYSGSQKSGARSQNSTRICP